jgi:hypothetical protein
MKQTKAEQLAESYRELNLNNVSEDELYRLNDWSIEAFEELRRLSPMEARVKELEDALGCLMADIGGGKKFCGHGYSCVCAFDKASQALAQTVGANHD